MVPAWLEVDEPIGDVWAAVAAATSGRSMDELVERALLLGLPIGLLPQPLPTPATRPANDGLPIRAVAVPGPPPPSGPLSGVVVVDLSSLWAGPLCGSLLATAGATVIKVESLTRPDGARLGPAAFFDLLNAGKRSVALDLRSAGGVTILRELLAKADVVIEPMSKRRRMPPDNLRDGWSALSRKPIASIISSLRRLKPLIASSLFMAAGLCFTDRSRAEP